jgi:uncharacterized membrane protein
VVHPFDLRSALLAKHAQHVVLVHFPVALFLTGVGFDFAARWTKDATKRATLAASARLNLLAAAVAVVPTLATGVVAWQWQFAGQKLKGVLLLHLALACASSFLICLVGWIQFRRRRSSGVSLPGYCLGLELLTGFVVALTAHLGGFLSGVNLPG